MNRHGWVLRELPATRPASRMRCTASTGMGRPAYSRTSRLLATARKVSTAVSLGMKRLSGVAAPLACARRVKHALDAVHARVVGDVLFADLGLIVARGGPRAGGLVRSRPRPPP